MTDLALEKIKEIIEDELDIEIADIKPTDGKFLVLCSDGLLRMVILWI